MILWRPRHRHVRASRCLGRWSGRSGSAPVLGLDGAVARHAQPLGHLHVAELSNHLRSFLLGGRHVSNPQVEQRVNLFAAWAAGNKLERARSR